MAVLPTSNGAGSRTVERRRGDSGLGGATGSLAVTGAGSGARSSR